MRDIHLLRHCRCLILEFQVDAGRPTPHHWRLEWRIHLVERPNVQLRDHFAGNDHIRSCVRAIAIFFLLLSVVAPLLTQYDMNEINRRTTVQCER